MNRCAFSRHRIIRLFRPRSKYAQWISVHFLKERKKGTKNLRFFGSLNHSLIPPKVKVHPMNRCALFRHRIIRLFRPRSKYAQWISARFFANFSIPAALGQPGQSKSLLFKRNFNENRNFSPSRPLPASPGNQNHCFLKGISMKIDTFLHPGRSRPARAIKIATFLMEFQWKSILYLGQQFCAEHSVWKGGVV